MAAVTMIAVGTVEASKIRREIAGGSAYLRLPFDRPLAFLAALAVFLGDLRAGLPAVFFFNDDPLPLEKIVSQLSEYCFVAPIRTTLIVQLFSMFKK